MGGFGFKLLISTVCWLGLCDALWSQSNSSLRKQSLNRDILEVMNSLPSKSVTLDLLVEIALQNSEAFALIEAQKSLIPVFSISAQAPLDWKWQAGVRFLDDRGEPQFAFVPQGNKKSILSVGGSKYFTTGTTFTLEVFQDVGELQFGGSPSVNVNEAQVQLTLKQDLWQGAFGRNIRWQLEAAEVSGQIQQEEMFQQREEWLEGFIGLFYSAWHAQSQAKEALESLTLRQRLYRITKKKLRRGTAERPDLIQAKSAMGGSEIRAASLGQSAQGIWNDLVISLKSPSSWMDNSALLIPIELDQPIVPALNQCAKWKSAKENSRPVSQNLKTLQFKQHKKRLDKLVAEDQLNPLLGFQLTSAYNGVDDKDIGSSWEEVGQTRHPNYLIGLQLQIPWNRWGAKAQIKMAKFNLAQVKSQITLEKERQRVYWVNLCQELSLKFSQLIHLKSIYQDQKTRQKLEEQRFQIGQIPIFNVITAGEDVSAARLRYFSIQVESRGLAWKVNRLSGKMANYMSQWLVK